jgi:hypothetical protein
VAIVASATAVASIVAAASCALAAQRQASHVRHAADTTACKVCERRQSQAAFTAKQWAKAATGRK